MNLEVFTQGFVTLDKNLEVTFVLSLISPTDLLKTVNRGCLQGVEAGKAISWQIVFFSCNRKMSFEVPDSKFIVKGENNFFEL